MPCRWLKLRENVLLLFNCDQGNRITKMELKVASSATTLCTLIVLSVHLSSCRRGADNMTGVRIAKLASKHYDTTLTVLLLP